MRLQLLPIVSTVVTGAVTLGCSDRVSTSPSAVFDTTGTTVIVRNGSIGSWNDGEAWSIERTFRVGGAEGPEYGLFGGNLTSVSIGPQGGVHALNWQTKEIRVFDRHGDFVRSISREGKGPGELDAPIAMGWDGLDRLWIPEAYSGFYHVFDSTGAFLKTIPRRGRVAARLWNRLPFLNGETFIDQSGAAGAKVLLRAVDTAGRIQDSFPPLQEISYQGAFPRFLPPDMSDRARAYLDELIWTITSDGRIWMSNKGELRLIQRNLEGDTIRIVETQHRDPRIPDDEWRWLEGEWRKAGVDAGDVGLVRPIVQSIHVLADGHVLVQIENGPGENGRVIDVFDPEGRFLGSMETELPMNSRAMPGIVGDTIVTIVEGPMDVPYLERLVINRGS